MTDDDMKIDEDENINIDEDEEVTIWSSVRNITTKKDGIKNIIQWHENSMHANDYDSWLWQSHAVTTTVPLTVTTNGR